MNTQNKHIKDTIKFSVEIITVIMLVAGLSIQMCQSNKDRKTLIAIEAIKVLEKINYVFHNNDKTIEVRARILQSPCNYKVLGSNDDKLNTFQNYINLIDKAIFYSNLGLSNEDLMNYYVGNDIKAIKKCPSALEQLEKTQDKNPEYYKDLHEKLNKE